MKTHDTFSDTRGLLTVFNLTNFPLEVKRFFLVHEVPQGVSRGDHAHRNTNQYLVCVRGCIHVETDNGKGVKTPWVLYPGNAVLVKNMVWSKETFVEKDSILLVLCDTEYDAADYITDKQEFYTLTA